MEGMGRWRLRQRRRRPEGGPRPPTVPAETALAATFASPFGSSARSGRKPCGDLLALWAAKPFCFGCRLCGLREEASRRPPHLTSWVVGSDSVGLVAGGDKPRRDLLASPLGSSLPGGRKPRGETVAMDLPRNAVRSFLSSMGTIEMLVMGHYVIRRKRANVRTLLGEEQRSGAMTPPSFPRRAGAVDYQTTFSAGLDEDEEEEGESSLGSAIGSKTRVRMPDRPMHNELDGGGWLELLDELEGQLLGVCDGTVGVNEILSYFTAMSENDENYNKITDADQFMLENIMQRLVRLHEHTLISW